MVLISLTACGQKTVTQDKMTPESWEEQSKLNKNLLPKYGHQKKTIKEKKVIYQSNCWINQSQNEMNEKNKW